MLWKKKSFSLSNQYNLKHKVLSQQTVYAVPHVRKTKQRIQSTK